jgi:pimeloyl-ACP methyl ester carboxylesterase
MQRHVLSVLVAGVYVVACLTSCRAVAAKTPNGSAMRTVETRTIRMSIRDEGAGPLVLMLHGFPELSHSWRHQVNALSAAGYRAVAPDMRGFGNTEAPEAVEAYDLVELAADVVALMDALGEEEAVLVGQDWGAVVAWTTVLLYPERFTKLIALSVPYGLRPEQSVLGSLHDVFGENFYYVLYFQEPGVAEAEFDPDPRAVFERAFVSPGQELEPVTITSPLASAGGWLGRTGRARELPAWFTEADMQHYVETFERTGFRGGLSYYRNFDRSWKRTAHVADTPVAIPVLFLAGAMDPSIGGATREQLKAAMAPVTENLTVVVYPETGHWVQQERAEEVNTEMLRFLADRPRAK